MASSLLRGIPVDAATHASTVKILDTAKIKFVNRPIPEVAEALYVSYDHDALLATAPLRKDEAQASCLALLGDQSDADFGAASTCGALAAALEVLWGHQPLKFHDTLRGYDQEAHRIAVSNMPEHVPGTGYTLTGTREGFFTRFVSASATSGAQIQVELTPRGHVMRGTLVRSRPAPEQSDYLLERETLDFDHKFRLLKSAVSGIVLREAFQRTIRDWVGDRASGTMGPALPTDGAHPSLAMPLRAMMLESALDWQASRLMRRLDLEQEATEEFGRTGRFTKPLIFNPLRSITASLTELTDGRHGTIVGLLIASDLPGLNLSLMSVTESWWSHPTTAAAIMISKIEHHRPQVVNISQDFSPAVTDCQELFGPVFSRFQDSVLFVASSGNYGMRDSPYTCPGSLAHLYPNVMSVGGLVRDGTLGLGHERKQAGNFGAETVDIAAPMDVDVPYERLGKVSLESVSGTSFSAAAASNAALRIMARRPDFTPKRVKAVILGTCDRRGLDVACGGALDINAIEEWLESEP